MNGCQGIVEGEMFLEIEHRLNFGYDAFISESFLEVRLQPKTGASQTVHSFLLAVGPPTKVARYLDWNENIVHHFTINKFHERIEILGRSLVNTHPAPSPLASVADALPLEELPYDLYDFVDFGGPVRLTPLLRKFGESIKVPATAPLEEQVRRLGESLRSRFEYQKDVTKYDSTTEDFLKAGAGVCQDFTHLMLGLLRLRRIPCRYVSGYLHVERKREEAAQSHSWVECYSPRAGWVPFDPTHNREPDERYVVVGHGRHYDDVPPNRGIYRGNAKETLQAEVFTRPSTPKRISTLHEEIEAIDLPVFQEIPARRRAAPHNPALEAAIQQQQ